MKFSYNWLKEYVSFKETPEKLAEILTLKAFEVESAERAGNDWLLNIALSPNRIPDASGHIGLAREVAAITGSKLKNEAISAKKYSTGLIRQFLDVKVENSEDCPRYMALMIDKVKVKESPAWLKQRLELCGLQSINNLVDAANYVMLETGQPLHVFDYFKFGKSARSETSLRGSSATEAISKKDDKVEIASRHASLAASASVARNDRNRVFGQSDFNKIVVRRAKKGEKILGLDDKEYELNPEILVIADSENPIAIAGIKGGKESGVTAETKTIVLEAANFSQTMIRSGSKLLNLKTDASFRFEHGLDRNLPDFAIRRLADLIERLSGGSVKGIIDVYPKKAVSHKLLLRLDYANRLIGVQIPTQFYKNALLSLGMIIEEKNKLELIAEIPTARRDLMIEEDLIEEIARLYGYEKIPAKLPEIIHSSPEENDELFWENKIRNILTGNGFQESFVYQFTGEKELADFEETGGDYWELENPVSEETKYLTARPLIKYLKQASENLRNFDEVRIFGMAKSFFQVSISRGRSGLEDVGERKQLILALARKGTIDEEGFYELKGVVDELLESLGIAEYWYKDDNFQFPISNFQLFHPYRKAEIRIDKDSIGIIGEIHPIILENIKSKARIVAAEIDFGKLWQLAENEAEYRPISKYPAIIRDIAIVVPFNAKTESILNIIENAGGELLTDSDLFDYFYPPTFLNIAQPYSGDKGRFQSLSAGPNIPQEGGGIYDEEMRKKTQKSLAFHLKFESREKTLKDEEIDKIMQKITGAAEKNGWIVRK